MIFEFWGVVLGCAMPPNFKKVQPHWCKALYLVFHFRYKLISKRCLFAFCSVAASADLMKAHPLLLAADR